MRKILIRFDDICPTMDWKQWNRAMDIINQYNIKPLIGVIPDCQDQELKIDDEYPEYWQYILKLQESGFAIAMHGYQHKYDTDCHGIVNRTRHSEFAGHTYEEQYEKIRKGKEILNQHEIYTDIFFAPAHSYDKNTLKALSSNGFKYISDGKSEKPFMREGILCIPCRAAGCPRIGKSGYYTAVFHAHEWTRQDKAEGYTQLKNLCVEYSDEIVSFEEYCKRSKGKESLQILSERFYLLYEYWVKPTLRPVVRKIKAIIN